MVAIIGGEPHRFRPLIEIYREAGRNAGHPQETLRVGIHALGSFAETTKQAAEDYFPGYARMFSQIGKERGWPPTTRAQFDAVRGPGGALIVGDEKTAVEKILYYNQVLGGIDRLTIQMSPGTLPHPKALKAIEILGTRISPVVKKTLGSS
jgi:alkanesulfonate monooxygenase SsuD/methylene tetrahydromethanopterin reductase-like flavin-dependent oxidoreductase (luciferase family)